MIKSATLPRMTFLSETNEPIELNPASETARIRGIAARIAEDVAPGDVVGLLAKTGPELVLNWLGALLAGTKPLILQYPTKKQSRSFWTNSVSNTVDLVEMAAIIGEDDLLASCPTTAKTISFSDLASAAQNGTDDSPFELIDYSILQLSSGTTGFRKAIEFTGRALERHTHDYDQSFLLDGQKDTVVSWLPLYHDMGYIACFVMPMILGIPIVMIDPMCWVSSPGMLYDAIEKYRGTITYMPNFGYELMSLQEAPGDLSSMRWWVNCSEPISDLTCKKFSKKAGVRRERFSAVYAMAENIFAMTVRHGIKTRKIEGVDVVSCGVPIKDVEMHLADDGEIFVRSPTSLVNYIGMEDIRNEEGFYPTGDLAVFEDGEFYITGRKRDLVIQAGRKFMLSDIDLVLNRLLPEVKGRGVACEKWDERLGTTAIEVLVEHPEFFRRNDADDIAVQLRNETGAEQLTVHFVPPRFLTKTSSGKFNRRASSEDMQRVLDARTKSSKGADPIADLEASFSKADWTLPVSAALDSLSLTMLRVILNEENILFNGKTNLNSYRAKILEARKVDAPKAEAPQEAIHIVSLADRKLTDAIKPEDIEALSKRFGRKVTFEHLCLPPSPIVLSDLIFHDWFQPRIDGPEFGAIDRAFDSLRRASLILMDDLAEISVPIKQTYTVLSHNLERDPRADRVLVRWQRYPQMNHLLPMSVISGEDMPLADRSKTHALLSDYLGIPIFRVATIPGFSTYTEDWEKRDFTNEAGAVDTKEMKFGLTLMTAIADWSETLKTPLATSARNQSVPIARDDLGHFCSHYVDVNALQPVIQKFDRFCLVGMEASAPFIQKEIEKAGKKSVRSTSYAPEILDRMKGEFDVVLACGAQGKQLPDTAFVAVMATVKNVSTLNVSDPEISSKLAFSGSLEEDSSSDWFCPFGLKKIDHGEMETIRSARIGMAQAAVKVRKERLNVMLERAKNAGDTDRIQKIEQAFADLQSFEARQAEIQMQRKRISEQKRAQSEG